MSCRGMSLRIARVRTTDQNQRKGRLAAIRCALHRGPLSGQTGLVHTRLLLTQHLLAVVAMVVWRCSRFHRSGRSISSTELNVKLTYRGAMHEIYCCELSRLNYELARRCCRKHARGCRQSIG